MPIYVKGKDKLAAVFGCGPSGLLAAEALSWHGYVVHIFSRKEFSRINGAQFLHAPIPGITPKEPDGELMLEKRGTREGYAQKVYGDPNAPCSWNEFNEGPIPCWSMLGAYTNLWAKWSDQIQNCTVTADVAEYLVRAYDLVASSLPAYILCTTTDHQFQSAEVLIARDQASCPHDTIVYSGLPEDQWYRTSRIFGHLSTEYGGGDLLNLLVAMSNSNLIVGKKPLSTDCDCYPDIVRVGRFGQWKKGVLVHHAWEQINAMHGM